MTGITSNIDNMNIIISLEKARFKKGYNKAVIAADILGLLVTAHIIPAITNATIRR